MWHGLAALSRGSPRTPGGGPGHGWPAPAGGTPDGPGILPGLTGGPGGAGAASAAVLACAAIMILGSARRRLTDGVPPASAILFPHEVPG